MLFLGARTLSKPLSDSAPAAHYTLERCRDILYQAIAILNALHMYSCGKCFWRDVFLEAFSSQGAIARRALRKGRERVAKGLRQDVYTRQKVLS